jgi:integrase
LANHARRWLKLTEEDQDGTELAYADEWREAQAALAAGRLEYIRDEAQKLLVTFGWRMEAASPSWGAVLHRLLQEHVFVYREMAQGELDAIPRVPTIAEVKPKELAKLSDGFASWQRSRERPARTINEATRAVRLFSELHGDLAIADIRRSHVRAFIEALQNSPLRRTKELRDLKLPEVSAWGLEHPEVPKLKASSINKTLAPLQAMCSWAALKAGMVPDDAAWSDPFASQRLEEDDPDRGPFTPDELETVFSMLMEFKKSRGASGFWLPVLAFYTGARQSELAGLTVENIDTKSFGHPVIVIERERKRGKSTKTRGSQRAVPVRPELIRIGLLEYAEAVRKERGAKAWLFPEIAPDNPNDAIGAWSTWFHAQIRPSVPDKDKVFHSFRHGMNDALIAGGVQEDVRNALLGWRARGMSGRYGVKEVVAKFGIEPLVEAASKALLPAVTISAYAEL